MHVNNMCTECVGSIREEDDTDYRLKGENCKHRWVAEGDSNTQPQCFSITVITLHNSPSKLLCPTRQSSPSRHRHHIGQEASDRELVVQMLGDCSRSYQLS